MEHGNTTDSAALLERATKAGKALLIVAMLPVIIITIILVSGGGNTMKPLLIGAAAGAAVLGVLGGMTLRRSWLAPLMAGVIIGLYTVAGIVSSILRLGKLDSPVIVLVLLISIGSSGIWLIRLGLDLRRVKQARERAETGF